MNSSSSTSRKRKRGDGKLFPPSKKNHGPGQTLWKDIVSNIQEALECPVCFEVVSKPFKQCVRGHLVCTPCVKTIHSTCPTCGGKFTSENPVCIQKVLEYLPRACRYSVDGCEEMVQDGDDHEKFCGFRRLRCLKLSCNQNVLAKEFLEHIKTVHPNIMILETDKETLIEWPNYATTKLYDRLYVNVFENVFWISLDNSDNTQLQISFTSLPIGKLEGDFYANVTFTKGNIVYVYTLKPLPYKGVDEDDSEDYGDRAEYCMKIPKSILPNFINKNGKLKHKVTVFKG